MEGQLIANVEKLYKFSGAGNDFVVIDGREGDVSEYREVARIEALCKEFKTDGLMILGPALRQAQGPDVAGTQGPVGELVEPQGPDVDFTMEFYNPDGSGGMMCGNGGRCIVAFADYLGIRPSCHPELAEGSYLFRAPDGLHTGEILQRSGGSTGSPADLWEVRIKMIDVHGITPMLGGYFLNTGTRHFVKFVDDVEKVDVDQEGKALRWNPAFAPVGTNVNFVHVAPDGLHVRTFEKGVEGETLACGTGLTASAIAAYAAAVIPSEAKESVRLRARQDWLSVDFTAGADQTFTDVYLTGPARLVSTCCASFRDL